jgi:hypothetical protein
MKYFTLTLAIYFAVLLCLVITIFFTILISNASAQERRDILLHPVVCYNNNEACIYISYWSDTREVIALQMSATTSREAEFKVEIRDAQRNIIFADSATTSRNFSLANYEFVFTETFQLPLEISTQWGAR